MAGTGSSVCEIKLDRFLSRSLLCSSSPASLVVRRRERDAGRRCAEAEAEASEAGDPASPTTGAPWLGIGSARPAML